jgi:hypothetical protein
MAATISAAGVSSAKMPGVEEAHDRARDVALDRFGPLRQEERIILARKVLSKSSTSGL